MRRVSQRDKEWDNAVHTARGRGSGAKRKCCPGSARGTRGLDVQGRNFDQPNKRRQKKTNKKNTITNGGSDGVAGWSRNKRKKKLLSSRIVSVLHQNEGGIGKSIPDAQEIS